MTTKTDRVQIVVGLVALAATAALAQQAARPADVPSLPPRGSLTVSAAAIAEILGGIKAPPGFEVTVFAAPPIVNYPACITATLAGELFVCVDRNSSLQADPGMGSVLRLVDRNNDGQADDYTVFATMDSPRGAVYDGDTLFVTHPPNLTAYRDVDGDGIADESRTLVRGLGFGLDFRGADHTVNGIELGVDGWLYIAVGDYGLVKALGTDGREVQMRGGGNVRVRRDGTGLEIYARGTRNDYDVAIDPYMNLFARGNTNDGGGWDIRLNHFVAGARYGYPSLFRNFGDEVVAPLADYGGGSGTGMLFVQDPGLPAPFGDTLYSVDWGTNYVYRHPLQPRGATFTAGQEVFLGLPRPTDIAIDGASRLYAASWKGGQYRYGGEEIGYIARLTYPGATASQIPDMKGASDARLVELITSANQVHRRFAQHELVRRGPTPARVALLEKRVLGAGPLAGRVSAIFTLKQLAGADAHGVLVQAAADPAVRAFALRALADRREELAHVPKALFVQALGDPDPRVQLQAITGLKRLGAVDAARAILPLTASTDLVVPHVAIDALVSLGASDAALSVMTAANASPAVANGALRVLQQIHNTPTVTGLIDALAETRNAQVRAGILQALARLYHREGVWRGTLAEWWGTRPDTTGPYYDPVAWEESPRILSVLRAAVVKTTPAPAPAPAMTTTDAEVTRLTEDLERNRVLPPGGGDVIGAVKSARDAALPEVADALLGTLRLDIDAKRAPLFERLARQRPAYRASVVKMLAAGTVTPQAGEILRQAAVDASADAQTRATALASLATATGTGALERAIEGFASLNVAATGLSPSLDSAWRQFVSAATHAQNIATFRELTTSTDASKQILGYSVLLQIAAEPVAGARGGRGGGGGGRGGRGGPSAAAIEAARAAARKDIDAAWQGPSVASLLRAIGATEAAGYRDRIQAYVTAPAPDIREAAAFASTHSLAETATVSAALVSTVSFEELPARVGAVTGPLIDVQLGKTLFTRQGCAACHTASPEETEKGPYLGGITTRYSRAELIESIARPAAKIAQGFATNFFDTTDGRHFEGFVVREGGTEVVIRDLLGVETTLRKDQIKSRGVREGSIMPPGLVDTLTLQELASLLAYLGSTTGK
jgi:putative membrane-bound dehydrogenase-like protein